MRVVMQGASHCTAVAVVAFVAAVVDRTSGNMGSMVLEGGACGQGDF